MPEHKGGKKNRKHGNNKVFCQRYRLENREEKNRARRQRRHVRQVRKHLQKLSKRQAGT